MSTMNSRPQNSKFHRQTQRILDKRQTEVVPVGAWVEICPQNENDAYAAVVAAEYEEQRIQMLQAEKEAKLTRFRQEVRSRVRELQRIKKQKQLQESFQAVNLQGRVVDRTAPSANILSHRKDTCIYHSSDPHAIGHFAPQSTAPAGGREGQGDVGAAAIGEQVREQAGMTRRLVQKAKHDLAAKQLIVKPKVDKNTVPGGTWGTAYSRDKPNTVADEAQTEMPTEVIDLEMTSSTQSDQRLPQDPIEGALYDDSGDAYPNQHSIEPRDMRSKHVTFSLGGHQRSPLIGGKRQGHLHGYGDQGYPIDINPGPPFEADPKTFSDEHQEDLPHCHGDGGMDVRGYSVVNGGVKGYMVPEVNPGVVAEEQKRQHGMQFSMYRRLYMDIEREQVRENMRKKTHHKKIQELKRAKEQERLEVEHQSHLMTQPDNILRESEEETRLREMEEAEAIHRIQTRLRQKNKEESEEETTQREMEEAEVIHRIQTRLRQKNKETKRFIQALRAMMKERIKLLGINPPPLCACGPSVWDANPETCANNCIFYRNPKAYAKALASVLSLNDTG